MAKRIEAIVKPELLIWARKSIGLTQEVAARKIGVKIDKLIAWERGEARPTINQLRKASDTYKRPLAVFYLPEPPKIFDAMRDFRKIAEVQKLEHSPGLLLEIRRAQYKREVALEISQELGEARPSIEERASIHDNPDSLSERIRGLLKISMEEQFKWRAGYYAFNQWKAAIEDLGILVFQTAHTSHIDLSEMRGFSITEKEYPIIVINSKDSANGKIFTLLHEFTHLLLNNGGICDLEHYSIPKTDTQQIEVFCNRIAGSVLVPRKYLLNQDVVIKKGSQKSWNEDEIAGLASLFSVSREVILRRLLILNRTTEQFYQERRGRLHKERELQETQGFPPYYRLVIRNNGLAFTRIVLNAYYQELITSSQVSDYLGTKLKHLNKIEKEVMEVSW